MPYVICDPCRGVKNRACAEVCPVSCIQDAGDQCVIDPDACINCGDCAAACPVSAIFRADRVPAKWRAAIERNAACFRAVDQAPAEPAAEASRERTA